MKTIAFILALASPWILGGAVIGYATRPDVGVIIAGAGTLGIALLLAFFRGASDPHDTGTHAEPTRDSRPPSRPQE